MNIENRFQFPAGYPNAVTPMELYRAGSEETRKDIADAGMSIRKAYHNVLESRPAMRARDIFQSITLDAALSIHDGLEMQARAGQTAQQVLNRISDRYPRAAKAVPYVVAAGLSYAFLDNLFGGAQTAHAADSQPCSSIQPDRLITDSRYSTGFVDVCTGANGENVVYYPPSGSTPRPEPTLPPPLPGCYEPTLVDKVVQDACNNVRDKEYPCLITGDQGAIAHHLEVQVGGNNMAKVRNLVLVSDTGSLFPLGTIDPDTGGDMFQPRDARCEFLPVANGGSKELTSLPTPVVNGQSGLPPTPLQGVEQDPWGFFDNVGYYAKGTFTGLKYMLSVGVPSWIIWKFAQRRTGRIQAEQNEARITEAEVARDRRTQREAARLRELEARSSNSQNNN